MKILFDGKEYVVKIKHNRIDDSVAKYKPYQRILKTPEGVVRYSLDYTGDPHVKGGVTEAYVIIRPDITIAGRAICSIKDNFNKKIGTKIATERLMSLINRIK